MSRPKIPIELQQQIRERAGYLCEYCHASEIWQYVRFTTDHIIPLSLGGQNTQNNLCLACFHCNRRKGGRITGRDSHSGTEVPLFHPRKYMWKNHFIWSPEKLRIIGLSQIGRATVELLQLNRERVVRIRAADIDAGRHPPPNDPVWNQ